MQAIIQLGRRERPGEQIALPPIAAKLAKLRLLSGGFDPFGDIRFPSEVKQATHPFSGFSADPNSPNYLNIPVNAGRDPARDGDLSGAFAGTCSRAAANRLELDANRIGFARIISAVARARPGGVVVHCRAGHGRTGTAVALVMVSVLREDQGRRVLPVVAEPE